MKDNQTTTALLVTGAVVIISAIFFYKKSTKKVKSLLSEKNKSQKHKVTLSKKQKLSPDTYKFTFSFGDNNTVLGINNGQHVKLHIQVKDEMIFRNYTPTSSVSALGYFDIFAKIYRPNTHPQFPDGGKFTPHLENLSIGEQILVTGPVGKLSYQGKGTTSIDNFDGTFKKDTYKHFLMIAGGTGLTPMYQIIDAITSDPQDKTSVSFLYVNRNEEDILMREDLEEMRKKHNIGLNFSLTAPKDDWKLIRGRVNKSIINEVFKDYMGKQDDCLVMFCGPDPFNKGAKQVCQEVGFKNFYTF